MNASRTATALAGIAVALWALLLPHTADLAAQAYRADAFAAHGWQLWDPDWFGGHGALGYSLLTPPLMATFGLRAVGVAAALGTTFAAALILRRLAPDRWEPASAWIAWAAVGDLAIGRLTYATGVCLGLLAVLCVVERHLVLAAMLGAACAAASPVAGLFLVAIAAGWAIRERDAHPLSAAAGAAPVTVLIGVLLGDSGHQPYPWLMASFGLAAVLVLRASVAREERLVRVALALYAAAIVLCVVVATPMGSNVVRPGVAFGPVLVLCARRRASRPVLVAAAVLAVAWLGYGPAKEVDKALGTPATSRGFYAPLIAELGARLKPGQRVEVVATASRWEVVRLRDRVPLARGWETQLDRELNPVFRKPTPHDYLRWLRTNAVAYVALPSVRLELGSRREAELLRSGVPGLELAASLPGWTLYRVSHAKPFTSGATFVQRRRDRIVLRFTRPGTAIVRERWSPVWTAGPEARLRRTAAGMIAVDSARRGDVVLRASLRGLL